MIRLFELMYFWCACAVGAVALPTIVVLFVCSKGTWRERLRRFGGGT